jgi:hypothetical protein
LKTTIASKARAAITRKRGITSHEFTKVAKTSRGTASSALARIRHAKVGGFRQNPRTGRFNIVYVA